MLINRKEPTNIRVSSCAMFTIMHEMMTEMLLATFPRIDISDSQFS